MNEIRRSLMILRYDAMERGLDDLSIMYGFSAIRLGSEMLSANVPFKDPDTPMSAFKRSV